MKMSLRQPNEEVTFNKDILEYVEIVVTDGNSWILNIESHSSVYPYLSNKWKIIFF